MNWNGGADEDAYPYVTSSLPDALERTAAQNAKLYLENAYRYNFAEETDKDEAVNIVKKMIMDYGAVSWSYYNDAKYVNESTGAYYNNAGGSGSAKTNHAIMAVGWDDDYPKENFREDIMPENNGAWIIRNSWGRTKETTDIITCHMRMFRSDREIRCTQLLSVIPENMTTIIFMVIRHFPLRPLPFVERRRFIK